MGRKRGCSPYPLQDGCRKFVLMVRECSRAEAPSLPSVFPGGAGADGQVAPKVFLTHCQLACICAAKELSLHSKLRVVFFCVYS